MKNLTEVLIENAALEARNKELADALDLIKSLAGNLHTMKGLRVWATEENRATRVAIIRTIGAALENNK